MKTNYTDWAKRYELAEQIVWAKLDVWHQNRLKAHKAGLLPENEADTRFFDGVAAQVNILAESSASLILPSVKKQTKVKQKVTQPYDT